MICFNSRTHAGCDQKGNNSVAPNPMFQFTHPRGVRPFEAVDFGFIGLVSIHAPTRGATKSAVSRFMPTSVFQFTHPRGVRPNLLLEMQAGKVVSIHAPTRGATSVAKAQYQIQGVSIHAPTRGATLYQCQKEMTMGRFQFTHPRGVRQEANA